MQNYKSKIEITDDQDEMYDVVDQYDRVIGQARRKEVHGNPKLMHRSIGVVIFNSKGEIFLQKRSKTKDLDSLKWTISCSGHLISDSSTPGECRAHLRGVLRRIYEQAAHRELKEELGVDLDIKPVTKFIYNSEIETEMVMLFRAYYDGSFQLNKKEINQGKFFTRNKLKALVKSRQIDISKWGKMTLEKMGIIRD